MIAETRKTMIGGFVVAALLLGVTSVIIFGSGNFFKRVDTYVLYFEDSVKGLAKGSQVLFRGVVIGEVTDIRLVADMKTMTTQIPVVIQTDPSRWDIIGENKSASGQDNVKLLIDKGMRAELQMQSMVTGQYQISLEFYPDQAAVYRGTGTDLREIPTVRGKLNVLAERLGNLPIEKLFNQLSTLVSGLDRITKDLDAVLPAYKDLAVNADQELMKLSRQLNGAVADYQSLAQNISGQIPPLGSEFKETARSLREGIAQPETLIEKAGTVVDKNSPVMNELTQTLKELSMAARSIRAWADYLEQHPEALIQGKGEYRR